MLRRQLPSVLDFPFQETVRRFASDQVSGGSLAALFADDDYYTSAGTNAYGLTTFLGNHDMGRIGFFLSTGTAGRGPAAARARPARARPAVPHARGARRVLRRRGRHDRLRRRHGQERPPGHVPHAGGRLEDAGTGRRGADRRRNLADGDDSHRGPAGGAGQGAGGDTPRCPWVRRSPATAPARSSPPVASMPRCAPSTSSRSTRAMPRRRRDLATSTPVERLDGAAGRPGRDDRCRGPDDREPASAIVDGAARRPGGPAGAAARRSRVGAGRQGAPITGKYQLTATVPGVDPVHRHLRHASRGRLGGLDGVGTDDARPFRVFVPPAKGRRRRGRGRREGLVGAGGVVAPQRVGIAPFQ